jgi:hypothetical protein
MKIISNNQWRDFVMGYELTESERSDFDYIEDIDSHFFIRYRGNLVDLSDFMAIDKTTLLPADNQSMQDWQGYVSDSYFSGLVLRYSEDYEQYQIGTYIS